MCPLRETVVSPCGVRGLSGPFVPERGHGRAATPVLREPMAQGACSPGTEDVGSLPKGSHGVLLGERARLCEVSRCRVQESHGVPGRAVWCCRPPSSLPDPALDIMGCAIGRIHGKV